MSNSLRREGICPTCHSDFQVSELSVTICPYVDLVNDQIRVPGGIGAQGVSNNYMLTSDPNSNLDHQRFVSLQMMDTISSNESKQTTDFKTL